MKLAPEPTRRGHSHQIYHTIKSAGGTASEAEIITYHPCAKEQIYNSRKLERQQVLSALSHLMEYGYIVKDGKYYKIAERSHHLKMKAAGNRKRKEGLKGKEKEAGLTQPPQKPTQAPWAVQLARKPFDTLDFIFSFSAGAFCALAGVVLAWLLLP